MKISEEKLYQTLHENYDYLINKYPKNQILGLFMIGLANYGFAETSDIFPYRLICIYLPSFEELCFATPLHSSCGPIEIIDIRKMYTATEQHSSIALELLFCSHKIINPIYATMFNTYFIKERDTIGQYQQYERISKARDRAFEAVKEGNIFEAMRLKIASEKYLKGESLEECFHIKGDDNIYLWQVKDGKIKPDTTELLKEFNELTIRAHTDYNLHADKIVRKGVVELLTYALKDKVELDSFKTSLTKKENLALMYLKDYLQGENSGNVILTQLIDKYGLSRPVYSTLIKKLKEADLIETKNMGVKGMYINFFNEEIFK